MVNVLHESMDRIFCTSLAGTSHKVIAKYGKRADVKNLVGQAKREGLDMIPSVKFKNNYALNFKKQLIPEF